MKPCIRPYATLSALCPTVGYVNRSWGRVFVISQSQLIPCCCSRTSIVRFQLADPRQEVDLVAQLGERLGEVEQAATAPALVGGGCQAEYCRAISLKNS